jgi:hypothetical protein
MILVIDIRDILYRIRYNELTYIYIYWKIILSLVLTYLFIRIKFFIDVNLIIRKLIEN